MKKYLLEPFVSDELFDHRPIVMRPPNVRSRFRFAKPALGTHFAPILEAGRATPGSYEGVHFWIHRLRPIRCRAQIAPTVRGEIITVKTTAARIAKTISNLQVVVCEKTSILPMRRAQVQVHATLKHLLVESHHRRFWQHHRTFYRFLR